MVHVRSQLLSPFLFSVLVASFVATGQARAGGVVGSGITVVASGLDHPKGLAFGSDGSLYVAESGHSNGSCPPPTPAQGVTSGGFTGAVARVALDGTVTRVATGLRSLCDQGDYIGPSAVLPTANGLYILQGVCVGAFPIVANSSCAVSQPLLLQAPDGTLRPVAQFISHGNGDTPNMPDENPYSLAQGPDGRFYVGDGGDNTVWRFRPTATGGVRRISQPLVQFAHDPTVSGLTVGRDGTVYVVIFGKAPWLPGSGRIARVMPDGSHSLVRGGLITPIGVAISPAGVLYILRYSSAFVLKPFPHFLPNTGVVYRLTPGGALVPVVTGLNVPTAMTFGPNGNLYITNNGTGVAPTATGQVLSVHVGA